MTTAAGWLHISPPIIADLLRLPAGQEVDQLRLGLGGTLEVLIKGKGMPPCDAQGKAPRVTIIMRKEVRQVKPPVIPSFPAFESRISVHWQHDATQQWCLREWEPQYLTLATRP